MSHVVSDDFVRSDFVHDQMVANRKSSEFGIARDHAQMRLLGDLSCRLFDACNELGRCPAVV